MESQNAIEAEASRPLLPAHSSDPDEARPSSSRRSSLASDGIPRSLPETEIRPRLKRTVPRFDSLDVETMHFSGTSYPPCSSQEQKFSVTLFCAFQAIGILYSDLGTSPLYVYTSAFNAVGIVGRSDIMGALSIIIYSLTLIPLIKYVIILQRSNSSMEDDIKGGTFSLYSLICRYAKVGLMPNRQLADDMLSNYKIEIPTQRLERALTMKDKLEKNNVWKTMLLIMALFGASFMMGEGILTPCISVTAAVSGLQVGMPTLSQDTVIGVAVMLLVFLFAMQGFGTGKIGLMFAPIMCVWFFSLAAIGIYNIMAYDSSVFWAINPMFIYYFFQKNGSSALHALGGLVLCISGGELLFADLGKFPASSIQIAFSFIVYPCLLLTYIGQAAYLMENPQRVNNVFYNSIPGALLWPVLLLAVSAALIASRSVILATFSVIKLAVALDCFPRLKIIHTSRRIIGQIYIPFMNCVFMIMCVIITLSLREMHLIGYAYGVAIIGNMLITTAFVTVIMVLVWQTSLSVALTFVFIIGAAELAYLSAVLLEVAQGGWIPLALAFVFAIVMYIWHYGTRMKYQCEIEQKISMDYMLELGANLGTIRVPGIGLLYNELVHGVPAMFGYFMKILPAIHSVIVFVCIKYVPVAVVPQSERFLFRRVGPRDYHLFRCVVRYGYKDVRKENHYIFEQLLLQSLETFIQTEAQDYALEFNSHRMESVETSVQKEALEYASESDIHRIQSDDREETERAAPSELCLTSDAFAHLFLAAENFENLNLETFSDPSVGSLLSDFPSDAASSINLDDDAIMELEAVRDTEESGVVYLLNHADVRAKKQSWFIKKLVINYFYSFLSRNCRATIEALAVPHTRLIQVGMTYMV